MMSAKNQFDFLPRRKAVEFWRIQVEAKKRGKNWENFDSRKLNWSRRMQRSVIWGLAGSQKKSQIWLPPHHNWIPCAKFKEIQLYDVMHQIPAGVCQIHQNSSVLEKILRAAGLSPRRIGPLLGVQFNAEHSPDTKGGECEQNAIRAWVGPPPVIQLWLPTKIESLRSLTPLFAEIAQISRPDY